MARNIGSIDLSRYIWRPCAKEPVKRPVKITLCDLCSTRSPQQPASGLVHEGRISEAIDRVVPAGRCGLGGSAVRGAPWLVSRKAPP